MAGDVRGRMSKMAPRHCMHALRPEVQKEPCCGRCHAPHHVCRTPQLRLPDSEPLQKRLHSVATRDVEGHAAMRRTAANENLDHCVAAHSNAKVRTVWHPPDLVALRPPL